MSKTVFIPECMNPFEVIVNHHRYIYPGGTSQEVPDEVAEVIELHNKGHEERKPPETGGGGGSGDIDALIDGTITEVNSNSTIVRRAMFEAYTALTTANFPAATSIGHYAFQLCTALTTANFPVAGSIPGYTFYGCAALTTINFPTVADIGEDGFYGCKELATADFPKVTRISTGAFRQCSKLIAVILRNTTQVVTLDATTAFKNTPIATGTGYIYVPSALVDSYKSATNWSTYASQFRAIEDYPEITGG